MEKPKINQIIKELENELSKWKRITDKRLEWANETVEEVINLIKKYELHGKDDIELLDCPELNLGLRYRGAQNIGYFLYLVTLDTYNALPLTTSKINHYSYLGGNFNAQVNYMNTLETIETIKKLPAWVNCIKEKVEKITKKMEKANG